MSLAPSPYKGEGWGGVKIYALNQINHAWGGSIARTKLAEFKRRSLPHPASLFQGEG
jgi:hypothetical protein